MLHATKYRSLSDGICTLLGYATAVLLTVLLSTQSALARDIAVADAAALHHALQEVQAGDRLLLAEGDYGTLDLWPQGSVDPRFDGTVTIASADPAHPAVFSRLKLTEARNMVFSNLVFDYRAKPGGDGAKPFLITNSSDIIIRDSLFDGDNASGMGPELDGYGAGFGLNVSRSSLITIEDNIFRNFYRGLVMGGGDGYIVRGNDISGIRSDGMNFTRVTNLLIEKNYVHDFRRSLGAGDHADMIQFWTINNKTPTTGVIIRENILNIAGGDHTQSIFMRNEAVDSQNGGRAMFYHDITIEQNVIINAHLHGITVGEADGLIIRNNTLIRVPRKGTMAASQGRGPGEWGPRIRVKSASVNVSIRDNIAPGVKDSVLGWDVLDNLIIQDQALMRPGHYTKVFKNGLAPAPYDLANFIYKADGLAARAGLGATLLTGK